MHKDSEHCSACDFCFSHVYHSGMYLVLSKVRCWKKRGSWSYVIFSGGQL